MSTQKILKKTGKAPQDSPGNSSYSHFMSELESEELNARPTSKDAELLLRLYELRRETRFREARKWFLASFRPQSIDDFLTLCPSGSGEESSFRMVYSYWEMAASFVVAGILNEDLFLHNSSELLAVWERIKILVPGWRNAWKNPRTVANIEDVAARGARYLNRSDPEAYATFVSNMR